MYSEGRSVVTQRRAMHPTTADPGHPKRLRVVGILGLLGLLVVALVASLALAAICCPAAKLKEEPGG